MTIDESELVKIRDQKHFAEMHTEAVKNNYRRYIFYKKNPDASFSTCHIPERVKEDELSFEYFKLMTKDFLSKGLLFVNRNQPFKAVSI